MPSAATIVSPKKVERQQGVGRASVDASCLLRGFGLLLLKAAIRDGERANDGFERAGNVLPSCDREPCLTGIWVQIRGSFVVAHKAQVQVIRMMTADNDK